MTEIEQRRRDLKQSDPELYAYVSQVERDRLCDTLGNELSNRAEYDAANYVWSRMDQIRDKRNYV